MDTQSMTWLDACWSLEQLGWSEMVQQHYEQVKSLEGVAREIVEFVLKRKTPCVVRCVSVNPGVAKEAVLQAMTSNGVQFWGINGSVTCLSGDIMVDVYFFRDGVKSIRMLREFII